MITTKLRDGGDGGDKLGVFFQQRAHTSLILLAFKVRHILTILLSVDFHLSDSLALEFEPHTSFPHFHCLEFFVPYAFGGTFVLSSIHDPSRLRGCVKVLIPPQRDFHQ